MKRRWWQSYFSFSAIERKGIIALCSIIVLLLAIYISMPYWATMEQDDEEDRELLAAWRRYQLEHSDTSDRYVADDRAVFSSLFPFDPNTADSSTLIALGLRPKTAHLLLNWRRKGKVFYEKEELKALYTLKEEEYERLAPYIVIQASRNAVGRYYQHFEHAPLPSSIPLNTTDSATLVRLNGIGAVLAHKIVEKRKALGGFLRHEQLLEIYRFPDTVFKMLKEKLVIDVQTVRKMKLNTASFDDLAAHPYIGEKIAKNILMYKEGLRRFERIEQLRQVPLMNEEIYRKIAPYFILD